MAKTRCQALFFHNWHYHRMFRVYHRVSGVHRSSRPARAERTSAPGEADPNRASKSRACSVQGASSGPLGELCDCAASGSVIGPGWGGRTATISSQATSSFLFVEPEDGRLGAIVTNLPLTDQSFIEPMARIAGGNTWFRLQVAVDGRVVCLPEFVTKQPRWGSRVAPRSAANR
jgi:hypothetical protein